MRFAVCSVQKNRGPWLTEWVAFHQLTGASTFIIYLHNCDDDSAEIVARLARVLDIRCFNVTLTGFGIQQKCFEHAYSEFHDAFDWMAFIDGDEFLFSPKGVTISSVIARYEQLPVSALAVYWRSFGASGHVAEPMGLVTENYRQRAEDGFVGNLHVKSLVRADARMKAHWNAHVFETDQGTIDEKLSRITAGFDVAHIPTWEYLCINHYSTQSREFYEKIKRESGAADAGPGVVRPESWWKEYNRNEVFDRSLEDMQEQLAGNVRAICGAAGIAAGRIGGLPAHLR